ncbi:hypothetical protein JIMMER1_54 [Brevibacillus phage Jimmer1]|uniref:Uncharacterized protein n=4 Tax=Jimmervirus TaxID=1984788 RepID=S5M5G2_9CAUD|nr:hypothetical protein AVV10_gp056 [Brevibacillus phage Osiris]YP_009226364.1 hypothetical protein AXJ21_gp054 [Brevibacillus phage Jimmer1]YP_009606481.1 hypothetical protein FDI01_gp054 [Brevibacillus phage Jimmer2]ALA48066.1 hypothetical protein POWDER_56 [Brevibacillus phage Powder]AGR47191.1 hypothetical protein JIMMER2_54 [Brevibacillus phage Jimmer2]AGR47293.1 hypothetical protein JIMMER1_54 [Brevibacillus phage Jimmer1]ALA07377.1 hypothetical protein OSIRIS_56 [Brevibacillus phage Os
MHIIKMSSKILSTFNIYFQSIFSLDNLLEEFMTNYNIVCSYTNKEGLEISKTIVEEFWTCGIEEVMYFIKKKS